jgi:hypothetical protein
MIFTPKAEAPSPEEIRRGAFEVNAQLSIKKLNEEIEDWIHRGRMDPQFDRTFEVSIAIGYGTNARHTTGSSKPKQTRRSKSVQPFGLGYADRQSDDRKLEKVLYWGQDDLRPAAGQPLFDPVLGLRFGGRLPLHIGRLVLAAAL